MIIASADDFRKAARRRIPRFLYDYAEGGAFAEQTLRANTSDLSTILLRQRVLAASAHISLETHLFGRSLALPVILGPIGLAGMYARRGEAQAARAAAAHGVPFTLSTVSLCPLEEVTRASPTPPWFQLYVLKDRAFMKDMLARAQAAGVQTLVFTVDMPVPGARYRDPHSGMSGRWGPPRRLLQAMMKPRWAINVGLLGRPHDIGNVSTWRKQRAGLADYIGWLGANFDPGISWRDLDWIRETWTGDLILKGVLDTEDAREAVRFGADGVVVSNHGGRQLDGAVSTARALPAVADAVGGDLTVLADGGVRSGLDVVRMLALGAQGVLLGRAWLHALAARGEAGVGQLLHIFASEMRVAMALTGAADISRINRSILATEQNVT